MAGDKKVANSLVAVSCAAVLAVYAAGYSRTKAAATELDAKDAERRPAPRAANPDYNVAPVSSSVTTEPVAAAARETRPAATTVTIPLSANAPAAQAAPSVTAELIATSTAPTEPLALVAPTPVAAPAPPPPHTSSTRSEMEGR